MTKEILQFGPITPKGISKSRVSPVSARVRPCSLKGVAHCRRAAEQGDAARAAVAAGEREGVGAAENVRRFSGPERLRVIGRVNRREPLAVEVALREARVLHRETRGPREIFRRRFLRLDRKST